MNEVFITKIIYKNWKLDIFLNSNKYFVKGKCPDKIKNEAGTKVLPLFS